MVDGLFHQRDRAVIGFEIDHHRFMRVTLAFDRLPYFPHQLRAVGKDHLSAFGGTCYRDSLAYASGGSGDDNDLAIET